MSHMYTHPQTCAHVATSRHCFLVLIFTTHAHIHSTSERPSIQPINVIKSIMYVTIPLQRPEQRSTPMGAIQSNMSGHDVAQQLQDFAKAGRKTTRDETRFVGRLCEASKEFLWRKAQGLVKSAASRPPLYTYGSDATPLRLTGTFTTRLSSGALVTRH